jgi:hypothetical protein
MVNTFHFGWISSNGMIAQADSLHAWSSSSPVETIRTDGATGASHRTVKASRVDSSINRGIPLSSLPSVHARWSWSRVTPSVTVGNGATSAYTHWIFFSLSDGFDSTNGEASRMKFDRFKFCICSRSDAGTDSPMRAPGAGVNVMGFCVAIDVGVDEETGDWRLGVA